MSKSEPRPTDKDPVQLMRRVFDLAYGALDADEQLSQGEVRANLKQMGVDIDKGWAEMQKSLKLVKGRIKLAEAREDRLKTAAQMKPVAGAAETVASLIAQITGLLSLSGQAAVYARKWENSSIDDLKSLRDKLAKTAARAADRKNAEK